MTRCPNCESAIRIGAKFCTSCGFRLTVDEPAVASAVAPSRSPFSTTSTPAWSAGSAETSAPIAATVVTPEDEVEPAWSKVDDDSSDPDVRADAAGKDVGSSVPATSVPVGGTDGADANAWETPARDDQPEPSWFSPPAQDTSGPVSDDMIAALGDEPADRLGADVSSDADGDVQVAPGDAPTPEALRTTYTWNADDQQITAVRDTSGGESTAATTTGPTTTPVDGDPLAEARSLVVRLGDVLAAVKSGGGAGSPATAVPTSVADESDVAALRAIVKAAQERPRDVDVMLDLVLRADTISAVLTDRDLLLAALRGDEAGVEETWAAEDDEPSTYPAWRALP